MLFLYTFYKRGDSIELYAQVIADYNDVMTIAFYYEYELFHIVAGKADDMMELLDYVFNG